MHAINNDLIINVMHYYVGKRSPLPFSHFCIKRYKIMYKSGI